MRDGEFVSSVAQARATLAELYTYDPKDIDMTIPFNRLSEDRERGDHHGTFADWFADMPVLAADPQKHAELIALQDAYLQDPTEVKMLEYMVYLMDSDNFPDPDGEPGNTHCKNQAGNFAQDKFESMQIASHLMRSESAGGPGFTDRGRLAFDEPEHVEVLTGQPYEPQPWKTNTTLRQAWSVGSVMHFFDGNHNPPQQGWNNYLFDPFVIDNRLSQTLTEREQTQLTRLPWFLAGWLLDPSLQRLGGGNTTRNAEYLSGHILKDVKGAMITQAYYIMTMKWVNDAMNPRAYHADWINRPYLNYSPGWSTLEQAIHRYYVPGKRPADGHHNKQTEFVDDLHEERTVRFATNALLTRALVMADDFRLHLDHTGEFWNTDSEYFGSVVFRDSLTFLEEAGQLEARAIVERCRNKILWITDGNPHCGTDLNVDGQTDLTDLLEVLANFGAADQIWGDTNADDRCNLVDLLAVLDGFGDDCAP